MKKLTVALQGRDATKSQRFRPASGLSTVSTDMITPPFRRAHNGSKVTASGGTTTTSTRLFAKSRVVGLGKSGRKLLMGTTGDDREVVKGPRKRLNKKRKSNISKEPIRAQAASSLARFLNSGLVRNDQGVSEDVSSKSGSKGSAKDSGYSTQKSSSSLSHAADRLQNEGSLANKSGSIRSLFASSRRNAFELERPALENKADATVVPLSESPPEQDQGTSTDSMDEDKQSLLPRDEAEASQARSTRCERPDSLDNWRYVRGDSEAEDRKEALEAQMKASQAHAEDFSRARRRSLMALDAVRRHRLSTSDTVEQAYPEPCRARIYPSPYDNTYRLRRQPRATRRPSQRSYLDGTAGAMPCFLPNDNTPGLRRQPRAIRRTSPSHCLEINMESIPRTLCATPSIRYRANSDEQHLGLHRNSISALAEFDFGFNSRQLSDIKGTGTGCAPDTWSMNVELGRSATHGTTENTINGQDSDPVLSPSPAHRTQVIHRGVSHRVSSQRSSSCMRICKLCSTLVEPGRRPEDGEIAALTHHLCKCCRKWSQRNPKRLEIVEWLHVMGQDPEEHKHRLYSYLLTLTEDEDATGTGAHQDLRRKPSSGPCRLGQWARRLSETSVTTVISRSTSGKGKRRDLNRSDHEHSLLLHHIVKLLGRALGCVENGLEEEDCEFLSSGQRRGTLRNGKEN